MPPAVKLLVEFFSDFGGGRILQNALSFISCSPIQARWFSISSCTVFLEILSHIPSIFRYSCFLAFWSIIPFLHVCHLLFPNVLLFGVPLAMMSLPGPLRICPFRSAGTGTAAVNFFQDPSLFPWICVFGCLRHLTAKRRSPYRSSNNLIVSMLIS
jgi:hypothetical protein